MTYDSGFFTPHQWQTVVIGLDWLCCTPQPATALVNNGVTSPPVEGRTFTFGPNGSSRTATLVLAVAQPRYIGADGMDIDPLHPLGEALATGPLEHEQVMGALSTGLGHLRGALLSNPLEPGELYALAAGVERLGHTVTRLGSGRGERSHLVIDTPPHPTLTDAASRYRRGCPDRPYGRCDARRQALGECPWLREGDAALMRPAWVPPQ